MDTFERTHQERSAAFRPEGHWYTRPHTTALVARQQAIETQVVGITFDDRQVVAAHLWLGEEVWLLREPKNRFDRNAIRIMRQNGRQLGYLNRELAQQLAPRLDAYGLPIPATVTLLSDDTPKRSVRIRFTPPKEER